MLNRFSESSCARDRLLLALMALLASALPVNRGNAQTAASAEQNEFFERRIRPALIEHCYECHSTKADTLQGGLRLDTRAGVRSGGDSGPAVEPGRLDSLLLRALRYDDVEMPPDGQLPATVLADFEQWVRMGAPDPRVDDIPVPTNTFDLKQRVESHWCWQPVRPPVNGLRGIDPIIDRRLERQQLSPSTPADRRTLIRRLKFDMLGLPPTRTEIATFTLAIDLETAYRRLVDQWLSSPHFGEKWASHWLDVIRYSETKGHVTDQERPFVWKYRDYVIDAFNDDLPYDQFIIEHLAGDLLAQDAQRPAVDGRTNVSPTATGALFMHEMHFMAVDPVRQRWDQIDAQIDTVGSAFLGLTLGCARCHDHKFDAISQRDYYAFAGFFYGTEQATARTAPRAEASDQSASVAQLEAEYENFLAKKRQQRRDAQSPKSSGYFPISDELGIQTNADTRDLAALRSALTDADPSWPYWVRAATDASATDVKRLIRGNHAKPAETVPRSFLQALRPVAPNFDELGHGSGRMWLATQIACADNPLTTRVWVNRLWQHLFGRGLVATPNNFGELGISPAMPELLDYLAIRLIESEWSTKSIIREIVLSRAYRRSSQPVAGDPDNQFFARQNRRRLSAEQIRDNILATSGSLAGTMHGPSIQFFVPAYATANKPTNVPPTGALDGDGRRTVYLTVRRNFRDELLETFDFPDRAKSIGRRPTTIVPTQALAMLNGPLLHLQARNWASRITRQSVTPQQRIAMMFEQATGRLPNESESRLLMELVVQLTDKQIQNEADDNQPWTDLAHVLYNLDEFVVID